MGVDVYRKYVSEEYKSFCANDKASRCMVID